MRALFVTNFCPHYRVRTYEILAQKIDVTFLFVSQGQESYWDPRHGVQQGAFKHEYLAGFQLTPKVRVSPALVKRVWQANVDVVFLALAGRFAFPTTYALAKLRRKPLVLWTGLWSHPDTAFHRLTFPATKQLYRHSDATVVYGSHVRDYLLRLDVDASRIFIAPHSVDNDVYSQRIPSAELERIRRVYGLEGRRLVLYVGRLTPGKGLSHLIHAAGRLSDLRPVLMMVGDGELRDALAKEAREIRVDLRLAGYVPSGELSAYYALADTLVLPSVTTRDGRELWGLVLNEAMNQGTPVIATTAVGAAAGGLVRDGETGLIVREGDPEGLSLAIRRILSDRDLAKRLGEMGRREVLNWNNDRMAEAFLAAAEYAIQARSRK